MTSYRAGNHSYLTDGFSGLAEAPPTTWENYRRILRGAGRAIIRDSYPSEFAALAQTMQQPVATGRKIAILTPGGGTGASTVASLLALAYRNLRGDLIGLVDLNNLASGILPGVGNDPKSPREALGSLSVGKPTHRDEFRRLLGTEEKDPAVVRAASYEEPLSARATETLLADFARQCAVSLIECPPGGDDERTATVVGRAHAVVVVVDMTEQGMREGKALIDRVRDIEGKARDLRRNGRSPVMIVGNERTAAAKTARRGARELAAESGARMVTLRHNRRFRGAERLSFDSLEQKTRLEVLRIGALALTLARGQDARAALSTGEETA